MSVVGEGGDLSKTVEEIDPSTQRDTVEGTPEGDGGRSSHHSKGTGSLTTPYMEGETDWRHLCICGHERIYHSSHACWMRDIKCDCPGFLRVVNENPIPSPSLSQQMDLMDGEGDREVLVSLQDQQLWEWASSKNPKVRVAFHHGSSPTLGGGSPPLQNSHNYTQKEWDDITTKRRKKREEEDLERRKRQVEKENGIERICRM